MICEVCRVAQATQRHHKFPQRAWARRLYGSLIDSPKNIDMCCSDCHSSHTSTNLKIWSELDFCRALGIEPRSKQYRGVIK
jgi:hypothetical protein